MITAAKIISLLKISQLALAYHRAEQNSKSAKNDYHNAWRLFECDGDPVEFHSPDMRITRGDDLWDAAIEATREHYEVYTAARRAAYNVKCKLMNACRKESV